MAVNMLNSTPTDTDANEINFAAFTDLCRFCSLQHGAKINLFEKEAEQRQILYKVRSFLPIAVKICQKNLLKKTLLIRHGSVVFFSRLSCNDSYWCLQISKDDFLPKKICERCVLRLEQFYEWKAICLQSDTVLRNYSESMRAVTINFQVFNDIVFQCFKR